MKNGFTMSGLVLTGLALFASAFGQDVDPPIKGGAAVLVECDDARDFRARRITDQYWFYPCPSNGSMPPAPSPEEIAEILSVGLGESVKARCVDCMVNPNHAPPITADCVDFREVVIHWQGPVSITPGSNGACRSGQYWTDLIPEWEEVDPGGTYVGLPLDPNQDYVYWYVQVITDATVTVNCECPGPV